YNGVNGYYGNVGIQEGDSASNNNKYYNNCLYGNPGGAISLASSSPVQGTVAANPQFVNYQANGTGDYHLSAQSPCINAGTSQGADPTDYDRVKRPQQRTQGSGYDIGPYEWVPRH